MLRYGSGRTVSTTTTTTTEDSADPLNERRIRRLRLTLHAGDHGNQDSKTANTNEKAKEGEWKKKNGLIQRERPAGRESPQQHLGDMTNGVPESSMQNHGPKVYGVVQRTGTDRRQEVMAREWTFNHLQDEMKYIKEVRDSLEKVRERMYGQFGGMQQSMQKLSQEIRAANSHRRSLESEVKVRTAAMESFDQMNNSLISANIGLQKSTLQKSMLESCQSRVDMREDLKSLRASSQRAQDQLREKERELAAAQAENQTLRLQVESSQEASAQALQELSVKLQREYDAKLLEEQQKHRQEIESLQSQLDEYIRRLEEAERNMRIAEAKIAERDQRISEVERLLECMGKEKSHFQKKLQECEQKLRLIELTDTTDSTVAKRSKDLKGEAGELRERIKHLNDMVFCQQRKVKAMIEEVESLRSQVAHKDMFISELLDRIAIVECENNELEDKLKYFMSTQNRQQVVMETREVGVGCDLLPRGDENSFEPHVERAPTHLHSIHQVPPPVQSPPPNHSLSHSPPPVQGSATDRADSEHPLTDYPPPSIHPSSFNHPPPSIQPSSFIHPPSSTQPSSSNRFPPEESSTHTASSLQYTSELSSSSIASTLLPLSNPPPLQHPSVYLTTPIQPRTFSLSNPPPSRLGSSLLRYTPIQYSQLLPSNPQVTSDYFSSTSATVSDPTAGTDEVDSERGLNPEDSSSSPMRTRSRGVYTPFMKLMEITSKINIE
ncbi:myocardial zonula adherens protein isoform 1-T1 [Synchiropus picturatus]